MAGEPFLRHDKARRSVLCGDETKRQHYKHIGNANAELRRCV
jgi:hypothetical protein